MTFTFFNIESSRVRNEAQFLRSRGVGLLSGGAHRTAVATHAFLRVKPTPRERRNCASFLTRELSMLKNVKVIVCLGGFSLTAVCDELEIRPRPKFGHGVVVDHERYKIVCSYHPSQQ
ncbi:MAG: uracil-DNA glycosylase family protein, partial [Actinomycetota bacterium]